MKNVVSGDAETRLRALLSMKMRIQDCESELESKRVKWMKLGTEIRSMAQQISRDKEELIEAIGE